MKNILLIVADQWRLDQFGAGTSYTPNLDKLAEAGVSFARHYTQAIPCSPSRASMFTGLYAHTHGVIANGVPLDARHTNLAQLLRQSGYAPTLFGYTDTALDPRTLEEGDPRIGSSHEVLPGCDVGCHQPTEAPHDWLAHLRGRGVSFTDEVDVFRPDLDRPNATGGAAGHPTVYSAEDSDTAYLTDRLINWQTEQKPGWCAFLCYLRPHTPTIAPEPFNALVPPGNLAPPVRTGTEADEAAFHPFMAAQMLDGDAGRKCSPELSGRVADVAEKDWRSIRAIHLALMAEIDAQLGRLFQHLQESGEWDNTLVIFTSDHGEMMFDHRLCNQASWHEQCAHVPLIVRDPSAEARPFDGTEVDAFSEAIDLVPTLLDWLGRAVPSHLDGASVMPFLRGETPDDWRSHVVWEYNFRNLQQVLGIADPADCMMQVYRDADYKHAYMPAMPPVLIDMRNDPGELVNLAGDPGFASVERDYLHRQLQHRIHHRDRLFE